MNVHSDLAHEAEGKQSGWRGGYGFSADDMVCDNLYAAAEGRRAVDRMCNDDGEGGWGARRWVSDGASKVEDNARHLHRDEEKGGGCGDKDEARWESGDRCALQDQRQLKQQMQVTPIHTSCPLSAQQFQPVDNCLGHRATYCSFVIVNLTHGDICFQMSRYTDGDGVDRADTKPLHQPTCTTPAPWRSPERGAAGGLALRGDADKAEGSRQASAVNDVLGRAGMARGGGDDSKDDDDSDQNPLARQTDRDRSHRHPRTTAPIMLPPCTLLPSTYSKRGGDEHEGGRFSDYGGNGVQRGTSPDGGWEVRPARRGQGGVQALRTQPHRGGEKAYLRVGEAKTLGLPMPTGCSATVRSIGTQSGAGFGKPERQVTAGSMTPRAPKTASPCRSSPPTRHRGRR